jgi:hypothetical protein
MKSDRVLGMPDFDLRYQLVIVNSVDHSQVQGHTVPVLSYIVLAHHLQDPMKSKSTIQTSRLFTEGRPLGMLVFDRIRT